MNNKKCTKMSCLKTLFVVSRKLDILSLCKEGRNDSDSNPTQETLQKSHKMGKYKDFLVTEKT